MTPEIGSDEEYPWHNDAAREVVAEMVRRSVMLGRGVEACKIDLGAIRTARHAVGKLQEIWHELMSDVEALDEIAADDADNTKQTLRPAYERDHHWLKDRKSVV